MKQIAFALDPEFTHDWLDGKLRIDMDGETITIHADKGRHADDPYILAEIPLDDFLNGLRFLGVIE
jgi:hypothetical protein